MSHDSDKTASDKTGAIHIALCLRTESSVSGWIKLVQGWGYWPTYY